MSLIPFPFLGSMATDWRVRVLDKNQWVVTTPKESTIPFKRDTGLCKGMSYIDIREFKQGAVMIETVQKIFEKFTKEEVEMAKLSREMQEMIRHSPDSVFKQTVRDKNPKNCPDEVNDVSNALSSFRLNPDRLEGTSTR